jgi:signal transduction histidine kinase
VTASARRDGDALLVEVRDTGIGLAPEQLAAVFEKFVQGADPRAEKPRGTGLGLAICREIVERHGGEMRVASTLGRGSTFGFTLPMAAESPHG